MLNAFEYLSRLIEDGYFDDADQGQRTGLRRLTAASGALLFAQTPSETILPQQQEELVQQWHARQARQDSGRKVEQR